MKIKEKGIPNKIRLSNEAYARLKFVKSRTALEDWTIARLGLCLSLGDPKAPSLTRYLESKDDKPGNDSKGKEFNRYTLTGEYDLLYSELLQQYRYLYCSDSEVTDSELLKAHLNRGIIDLSKQVKGLSDIADLLAKTS